MGKLASVWKRGKLRRLHRCLSLPSKLILETTHVCLVMLIATMFDNKPYVKLSV